MSAFFDSIVRNLRASLNPETLGREMAATLANLVVALLVFAAFLIAWRIARPLLRRITARSKMDRTNAQFVETLAKMVILTLGTVHALAAVGVNMGALITSLGIAGLTIGFAARDALSNIISGVLVFWDRPFVIGDLVEVGGEYGRVENITLRSTRVVTPDGRMLAVPNSEIVNKTVASYTNFPNLRLDIAATIGVGEDIGRVRRVMLGVIDGDEHFMTDPAPVVGVTNLGDYNVTVELRVWLKDERTHVLRRMELRERLFEALRAANVDMPFETLQLRPVEVEAQVLPASEG
jgi:small conductance mechanosensitive channel